MPAEALAPIVAKSSGAMILTVCDGDVPVFDESESKQGIQRTTTPLSP